MIYPYLCYYGYEHVYRPLSTSDRRGLFRFLAPEFAFMGLESSEAAQQSKSLDMQP